MTHILLYWFMFAVGFAIAIGMVYAIVFLINKFANHRKTALRPYFITWATLSVTWLGIMVYGYSTGRWTIEVRNFTLKVSADRLPASFDGYKIVLLTDLHLDGWQEHPEKLERVVEMVNEQDADAILVGGDVISFRREEMLPAANIISHLSSRDGVYSVLGNHDQYRFTRGYSDEQRTQQVDSLVLSEQQLGWQVLRNRSVVLRKGGDSITLVGVEQTANRQELRRKNFMEAMQDVDQSRMTIVLSHDPSLWKSQINDSTMVDLTLTGHTYAWQMRIGRLTPAEFVSTSNAGWYHQHDQHIFVSVGLGSTMRFRVGATPEIAVITLRQRHD